jgi:hypothetical protein
MSPPFLPTSTSLCFFQGLTHLGKGTLTLCPYHSDRQLMSQVAVAGLLTVLVSFLDVRNSEFLSEIPCYGTLYSVSTPVRATLVIQGQDPKLALYYSRFFGPVVGLMRFSPPIFSFFCE